MKQVMVKVTGDNIRTWQPSTHSKGTNPTDFASWNIVEISCRLPKGTKIVCGNSTEDLALKKLKFFSWYGVNAVTDMSSMFYNCYSLIAILQLYTSTVINMSSMFSGCYSLASVLLNPSVTNWAGHAISFSGCSLGHAAILALFNSLPAITSSKTLTLTGNPGVPELTDEEKAIATGKNWTLTL